MCEDLIKFGSLHRPSVVPLLLWGRRQRLVEPHYELSEDVGVHVLGWEGEGCGHCDVQVTAGG